ncbi:alpha/beta hydrolase [Phormidesmis priestleyi]
MPAMKRQRKKRSNRNALIAGIALSIALAAGGYWYVFIAGAPQLDAPQAETQTGLHFQVESFDSAAMGNRKYGVVLPPGYEKNPQERYPVIVLLHGGHGTERDFEDKAALTSILHDLYRAKKIPPAIVITPDGNDNRGTSPLWDPDYYDGENGNVATLIGQDLVQSVKSRYRTLEEPQFWAIGGISSGGWGAFNIGLRHLNHFNILFSHTGYFADNSGAANSPQSFIQQIPVDERKRLRVYLDAGDQDHKYLQATQQFHQTLDRLGISNQFRIFPGGHGIVGQNAGWNYWHKHLADSLSYVGQQFRAAHQQIEKKQELEKTELKKTTP